MEFQRPTGTDALGQPTSFVLLKTPNFYVSAGASAVCLKITARRDIPFCSVGNTAAGCMDIAPQCRVVQFCIRNDTVISSYAVVGSVVCVVRDCGGRGRRRRRFLPLRTGQRRCHAAQRRRRLHPGNTTLRTGHLLR